MEIVETHVDRKAIRFKLRGLVQGQGVRPAVARLAMRCGIGGYVSNSIEGVEVVAAGDEKQLSRFERLLRNRFDVSERSEPVNTSVEKHGNEFQIRESKPGGEIRTEVPLDTATCPRCMAEVRTEKNRRNGYELISCAECGPRYSILSQMPFDRDSTTMQSFPLCDECLAEYRTADNRRFHAQTIACPRCGPRCWATDDRGNRIGSGTNAIRRVAKAIADGKIAAMKGIGGYQIICDAGNDAAVRRLRSVKARPGKPLAVMVKTIEAAEQIARVDCSERDALMSPANPIVLLRSRDNDGLSTFVAPYLNTIGVMLPTTPIHAMLADSSVSPLVVTSGNSHGMSLVFQHHVAEEQLRSIVDVFLHHDREILRPVDDSVVQCVDGRQMTIRAARGIAPLAYSSDWSSNMLAVAGHQKVAPAIATSDAFVLSPHVGDMDSESTRSRFVHAAGSMQQLYQTEPRWIVHDSHPGYFTTTWATSQDYPTIAVQHHHAHIAAAMLEHGLINRSVLGIAFDGTGFGIDETIWGGEVLIATAGAFDRIGHLWPFRLPGGEQAIKQPWRVARSLMSQVDPKHQHEPYGTAGDRLQQYAMKTGPMTTSIGRLFDGVASMVLGIQDCQCEAEPAMRLEAACDRSEKGSYRFRVTNDKPWRIDWRPVVRAVASEIGDVAPSRIAMKFHRAVARMVVRIAQRDASLPCVLSGGVFQNRTLLELIREESQRHDVALFFPGTVPVNDGGLALGQLVVAAASGSQPPDTVQRRGHFTRHESGATSCV